MQLFSPTFNSPSLNLEHDSSAVVSACARDHTRKRLIALLVNTLLETGGSEPARRASVTQCAKYEGAAALALKPRRRGVAVSTHFPNSSTLYSISCRSHAEMCQTVINTKKAGAEVGGARLLRHLERFLLVVCTRGWLRGRHGSSAAHSAECYWSIGLRKVCATRTSARLNDVSR